MKKTLLLFLIFFGFQINANCLKTDIADYNHAVNLKTDETLWVWSGNSIGKLGKKINTNKNVPTLFFDSEELSVTAAVINVSCNGMTDGSITITPSGGTAPYSYVWNNGETTATITGLAPGAYSCTVIDAASSTASLDIIVTQPNQLNSTAVITNTSCNGDNKGSITVTATGGTAPYIFGLDGLSYQASNMFNNLPAGVYQTYVRDSNGCTVSNFITIAPTNTPPPTANTQTLDNTSTVANLQATGSEIKWYNGITGGIALDLSTALQTGTYYVSQTINGCESTRTAVDVTINNIYTLIPDVNFENKLITLGIDSGVADGKVLTANVDKLTSLDVSSSSISDLTGIQDFLALTYLDCHDNQLTNLDVTKNVALTYLNCRDNQLTNLDVTKNVALSNFHCHNNQLTILDVSKNVALSRLYCYNNQLTSLDVSKNTSLNVFSCNSNQLRSLNLKNGNNTFLSNNAENNFTLNPNLTCIEVDDVAYSNANWSTLKDATASFSTDCSTPYTLIPDVNFENKLIALGIDSGVPDGKVPTANVDKISSLDVSSSSISDLTGIQDFVALTILYCHNNQLTNLDVTKNVALTELTCHHNQLANLDVTKNIALTYLSCPFNQLTNLDITKNVALEILDCSYNQLMNLDITKNVALSNFHCNNNQLATLDVSKNIALSSLYCYNNQLTTLDVSKNTSLNVFSCNSNQLRSLNLKNGNNTFLSNNGENNFTLNPNLTCIEVDDVAYSNANWSTLKDATASFSTDCSTPYTLIPDVNFENKLIALGIDSGTADGKVLTANVDKLTSLDVSSSSISDLTGIEDFKGLEILYCLSNQLTTLDLSKNVNLILLNCTSNQLTSLNLSENANLTGLFSSFNQLTNLDLSNNINLTDLVCSNNRLTSLDISKNINLNQLSCETNQISNLDVTNNLNLAFLGCHDNQLTSIDLSKNLSLTNFTINGNQITSLDVSKNVNLINLACSLNQLTSLDVSNNVNLKELDCSSNQLTSLDVSNNTNLKYLYSYSNQITALDLNNNILLETLLTYSNQITSLDVSKNVALTYLNCSSNNLTNLNLKNARNTLLTNSNIHLAGNLNLTCIQVDDVAYSNANWANAKDSTASYSIDCNPSYTLIPDVNFENKLIALGIDTGVADGKVLTSSISTLTSLDVSSSSISDLTGIQNFAALTTLYCSLNQLTTLDISNNIALRTLYCDSNQLTALDISKNTALMTLHCDSNQLTSLDLSNNTALKDLICSSNQLTSLNVDNQKALWYLGCSSNQLTTLDISQNTALWSLSCDSNQLTTLDISANTEIEALYCFSNQLTALDTNNQTKLKYLDCSSNQLTTLDVSKNVALWNFSCNSNQLNYLNLKNTNNSNLNTISFIDNPKLTCIQVDDATYSNNNWSGAKDISASYSTFCTYPYTVIPDVNFENKLISLGLDSGTTDGKVLTSSISSLTSLDVSSSSISDLTGIQDFASLKELNCNTNNLTMLDVSKNLTLTSLDCSYNKLSALDVSKNLSLENLRCEVNHITSLDISNNLSLGALYCYSNLLSDLDVSKNLLLTTLYIDNNKISSIDVSKNTILGALSYSSNNISSIDVSKNSSLGFLNCQSNQVTNLDLSHNLMLNSLYCQDNQITSLDLSKHIYFIFLLCQNNKLLNLNLKNGTNANFDTRFLNFTGNPDLTCIQVDDETYSNTNWANAKDITASYSTDCNVGYTLISDVNFEQKLIDLGIDTDGLNGKITTISIESITTLDLSNTKITDLSGIENFTALKYFTSNGNNLTSVDFSKNLMLEYISISGNNITSIDVSKNTNLKELDFSNNKVTQIDLSQNKELTVLNAYGNLLTTLDISQNPKLRALNIEFNQLKTLNLQNGNNQNFVLEKPTAKNMQSDVYTSFLNNSNLTCIKVDNVSYSNANWANIKDATAIYSSTCSTLGTEDSVFDKIAVYPNPVKNELHIDNVVLEKATVYDSLGKLIKTTTFSSGANDNTIHLAGLQKGVYYIYLESEGANTAKKIIVE